MKSKIKLIALQGIPGSGKSTWVTNRINETKSVCLHYTRRINRDTIREMCDNSIYSSDNEKTIIMARNSLIDILSMNKNTKEIIIDDCNFGKNIEDLKKIAEDRGWEFEVKNFNISLSEAIKRDKLRENPVGAKVIKRMYYQYIEPNETIKDKYPWLKNNSEDKINAVIVDIDGTACLHYKRNPYEAEKCDTDIPNYPVIETIKALQDSGYTLIFLSGRENKYREKTAQWLISNKLLNYMLLMRTTDDMRPDDIIKEELYNTIKDRYNILCVFDDRPRVVKKWKELGLFVFDAYQDIERIDF